MSVVISYYCDRFAMIMTDTMVSAGWGSYSGKKLYMLSKYGLGHCAGVGFSTGILETRDAVDRGEIAPKVSRDILGELLICMGKPERVHNEQFTSDTVFSLGILNKLADSASTKYNINRISIEKSSKDIRVASYDTPQNEFFVMYPTPYLADRGLFERFEKEHSLQYNYTDFDSFLFTASTLFSDIQLTATQFVSDICNVGMLYLRDGKLIRRTFKSPCCKVLEHCKAGRYAVIDYEIRTNMAYQ